MFVTKPRFVTLSRPRRVRRTPVRRGRRPMMSPTPIVSYIWLSLLSTVSSIINTQDLKVFTLQSTGWKYKNIDSDHHHHSISHPSWKKFQPKWYILILATSLDFPSLLSMPSTVTLATNSHLLNVVRYIEGINNFHVNHHRQTISRSSWRKSQLMWYIPFSATSLVFSSGFPSPSMVSLTTNSHVLNVWWNMLKVQKLSNQPPLPENFNWCDTSYCQRPPWSLPRCCH